MIGLRLWEENVQALQLFSGKQRVLWTISSAVKLFLTNQQSRPSGWLKYLAGDVSHTHYLQLLEYVQAYFIGKKKYLQETYNFKWVITGALTCHISRWEQMMGHQDYIIRWTLKTRQDAAISNDNCQDIITKCPCECLPPNPLVLLATF